MTLLNILIAICIIACILGFILMSLSFAGHLPEGYKWWYFAIMAGTGAILSRILFIIEESDSRHKYYKVNTI